MDDRRFDDLTRALAARQTSRTSRRALLGGLAGLAAGLLGAGTTSAACPPGQSRKRGQCVCKSNGRPPEGGVCPCPASQRDCGGGGCAACCADPDCDDGNACTTNTCRDGKCRKAAVACPPAADQCLVSVCRPRAGGCVQVSVADGTPCDDGNACTRTDACRAGACVGGNPVVCTALDQCHEAGVCDTATGRCTDPTKPDGTGCSDGTACTQTDVCQNGACVGTEPVECPPPDQCHESGVCDAATGRCAYPPKPDGTSCTGADRCYEGYTCQAGTCTAGDPVVCAAPDQCHDQGTCNPATGICANPAKPDGASCDDGNACTQTDTCQSGLCVGGNPVVCEALDQCHDVGTCDPATGVCSNPDKRDGESCNDDNACTLGDTCQAGVCTGGSPVVCLNFDPCVTAFCDPAVGCTTTPRPAGTPCPDFFRCDGSEVCDGAGNCLEGTPVQCDPCLVCDRVSGQCLPDATKNGAACPGDGNPCFGGFACQDGSCVGMQPVVCTASDQCHDEGTCDPTTGICSNPNKTDGAPCSDVDACTQSGACQAGICVGTNPVVCPPSGPCQLPGVCNPATGVCDYPSSCVSGEICTPDGCCPQARICADSAGKPTCCATGTTCGAVIGGAGSAIGICCPVGTDGCATLSSGVPGVTCCDPGVACAKASLSGLASQFGACCPQGAAACATFSAGTLSVACCGAGEVCTPDASFPGTGFGVCTRPTS